MRLHEMKMNKFGGMKLKKKKVFFLPYAGGSSMNYQSCYNYFTDEIEPVCIELAGRGKRYGEPFYQSISEAADDILTILEKELNGEDYIIFGHSMGAILAFELFYKIKAKGVQLPKCLFVSGRAAPNAVHNVLDIKDYDDETFIKLISFYGGLPEDFENSEIKKLLLPVLRADFRILDEYVYEEKEGKIESDLIILCGEKDFSAAEKESIKWKDFAGAHFSLHSFPEGHFFLNYHFEEITKMILEQF